MSHSTWILLDYFSSEYAPSPASSTIPYAHTTPPRMYIEEAYPPLNTSVSQSACTWSSGICESVTQVLGKDWNALITPSFQKPKHKPLRLFLFLTVTVTCRFFRAWYDCLWRRRAYTSATHTTRTIACRNCPVKLDCSTKFFRR